MPATLEGNGNPKIPTEDKSKYERICETTRCSRCHRHPVSPQCPVSCLALNRRAAKGFLTLVENRPLQTSICFADILMVSMVSIAQISDLLAVSIPHTQTWNQTHVATCCDFLTVR